MILPPANVYLVPSQHFPPYQPTSSRVSSIVRAVYGVSLTMVIYSKATLPFLYVIPPNKQVFPTCQCPPVTCSLWTSLARSKYALTSVECIYNTTWFF